MYNLFTLDSDQDVARADQYPNLTAAVNAANQYSQDQS